MDLWYLPKDISEVTNYKFVIIFMDQFSKLVWSYPVYEKNAITALQCLKNLFLVWVNLIVCIPIMIQNSKII